MLYLTYKTAHPAENQQLSFEDIFNEALILQNVNTPYTKTISITATTQLAPTTRSWLEHQSRLLITRYSERVAALSKEDMQPDYTTYRIPKSNGGTRIINEPNSALKQLLAELKADFEQRTLAHTAAYAYVKGRTTMMCCARHTKAKHKWWLKLDFHDFFGSCTEEFQLKQLVKIPFFYYWPTQTLKEFIHVWALNNGLPQGTPLSPWLTNQIMLPIDFEITKWCEQHNIVYTRYADDMQFSFDNKDQAKHIIAKVQQEIRDTPLTLNKEKTKVSSVCGQNWVLGMMCNKDFKAQIGHKKKDQFRAALYQFNKDFAAGHRWTREEAMNLLGLISYYREIEREWVDATLNKYTDVRKNLIQTIKL